MLFSATIPDEIRDLAARYMHDPETVRMHRGTRVSRTINHAFYPVHEKQKEDLLLEILRREKPTKALIFTATRERTSELALALRRRRYEVLSLSSVLSQANRERVLAAFRRGEFPMLVATDVAARGLDISDIDLVINFDAPMQAEDYVHRIGRTGRAEREGKAVTILAPRDEPRAADIERLLGQKVERLDLEGFEYRERSGPPPRAGGRRRPSGGRRRGPGGGGGGGGRPRRGGPGRGRGGSRGGRK